MASKAQSALGAVIAIGGITGASGTEVFTTIGDLTEFPLKRGAWKTVGVTNFASTTEEMLPVIKGVGSVPAKGNCVPNDAGQILCETAYQSGRAYDFKVTFPIDAQAGQTTLGNVWTFSAYVLSFELNFQPEGVITFDMNLQISGNPVIVQGS